ncbi:4Fe-4S dicluster domain-containing protein [Rhodococcus sp. ARC_M13]|uniref:4Fe-4S dicluster domain-containing protein n=1 Tax=Rhodococcus TaxID=1827 RepID=UPI00038FB995|nr:MULTISPECIES: 4Fe-4S dicluster domain-containing protein [Rhodococcus]ERB52389.1 4Fe-4S ferredoxin [Rhodococcus sp. P27]MBF7734878.1 4Fe-4S dicluster domain-containing protein [Rhodococcus erythropolis]MCJ0900472.1 4Fe-4S dicluster domain-containing protein [Rhodococcus sp. ARC_M13]MCZ4644472.1 4Fe-4S dicluster domain-containing protein [Rhodococcus erythropolis]
MTDSGSPTDLTSEQFVMDRDGLDELITVLISEGYRVIGPTVRDSAIVLDTLDSGDQLPTGWGVDTAPGLYRLRRRTDSAVFGHSAGPQSWKQYLHPSRQQLWSQSTDGTFHAPPTEPARYAFLGVRACDLAAIGILQTVLSAGGKAATSLFEGLFVIAANCTEPGGVCFCASMNTGPEAKTGYDLCLTERIDNDGHRFVTGVGTTEGSRILTLVRGRQATDEETTEAAGAVADAAHHMGRQMPDVDLRGMLRDARDADVWADVASRCLTCGNCTMVCPTCFCTTTEDVSDLAGDNVERWQHWSSCFDLDYSQLHGGAVRVSGESRYRQWISHKLGTWHDQFGSSGCVGCGRCIDWCPVGIDITAEAARLTGALTVEPDSDTGCHS